MSILLPIFLNYSNVKVEPVITGAYDKIINVRYLIE